MAVSTSATIINYKLIVSNINYDSLLFLLVLMNRFQNKICDAHMLQMYLKTMYQLGEISCGIVLSVPSTERIFGNIF